MKQAIQNIREVTATFLKSISNLQIGEKNVKALRGMVVKSKIIMEITIIIIIRKSLEIIVKKEIPVEKKRKNK
jgi:hypothetical protein